MFCAISCSLHKEPKQINLSTGDTLQLHSYIKDTLPNKNIRFRPNYLLTKTDTSNIKLNFFDTIPETIGSSGEFYTYDTTKLAPNKYIFLTSLVEYAIIKVKGKDIYLKKEYEKCVALPGDTFKDIYTGNSYMVIFIHKIIKHNDGVTNEIGTLEIKNSKHNVTINVHGGYRM